MNGMKKNMRKDAKGLFIDNFEIVLNRYFF